MPFDLRQFGVELSLSDSISSLCNSAKRAQLPVHGYHYAEYDDKEQQREHYNRKYSYNLYQHSVIMQRHMTYYSPTCRINIGVTTYLIQYPLHFNKGKHVITFIVRREISLFLHYPHAVGVIDISTAFRNYRHLGSTLITYLIACKFIKPIKLYIGTKSRIYLTTRVSQRCY